MAPNGEEGQEIDAMEAGKTVESEAHRVRKSTHSGAMASSILRFKDVNFIVGKGDKEKYILQDVSGKVKFGRECCSCWWFVVDTRSTDEFPPNERTAFLLFLILQ